MTKRALTLALLLGGLAAFSGARALYRIELRDNASVLANDQPAARGSVLLFHRHPDGRLTAVPSEEVAAVTPVGQAASRRIAISGTGRMVTGTGRIRTFDSARVVPLSEAAPPAGASRPLAPGEVLILGPTGSGALSSSAASPNGSGAVPSPSGDIPARAAIEAQVFPGDLPAPSGGTPGSLPAMGYGSGPLVINPTLAGTGLTAVPASSTTGISSGAQPLNPINPNGFPATTTTGPQSGTNPINPNGFPATTTTAPQSGTNPINPNGFPATTTTGPQSGTQPINPNGFPATTTRGSQSAAPSRVSTSSPVITNLAGTRGSVQSGATVQTRSGTVLRTGAAAAMTVSPNGASVGVPQPGAAPVSGQGTATPGQAQAAPASSNGTAASAGSSPR